VKVYRLNWQLKLSSSAGKSMVPRVHWLPGESFHPEESHPALNPTVEWLEGRSLSSWVERLGDRWKEESLITMTPSNHAQFLRVRAMD